MSDEADSTPGVAPGASARKARKAERNRRKAEAEWNAALRQAKADLAYEKRWIVHGVGWDFHVERMFFVAGFLLAAAGILITLAFTHARWSLDDVVLVPLFAAPAGWALARWFGPSTYPTEHVAPAFRSILIWLVFAALAWRLALWLLPNASGLGSVERWWLAPAVAGLVFVVGARMRLRGWVTFLAAFAFSFAPLSDNHLRLEDRFVAASSALQLQAAQASGDTVLMRSVEGPTGTGVRAPTSAFLGQVAAAVSCGHRSGIDQRRTVLGLPGRVIAFRADVCWDKDGKPVSAELDARAAARFQVGAFRPVRLSSIDPMEATVGEPLGAVPYTYEDTSKEKLPLKLRNDATGTPVFDADGRPYGYDQTTNGQVVRSDVDDPPFPLDTTLLHVSHDGQTVTMLYAVESRDTLVRHPQAVVGDGNSGEDTDADADAESPDRLLSLRAHNGYVTDVLTVTAQYQQGSALIEASILRATSHGATDEQFFGG